MKTLTLQTTIGPDGAIDLHISSDLPPGPAEVKVTIQPISARSDSPRERPLEEATTELESGQPADARTREAILEAPSKTCSGLFLGRLPEDYDIDAALDEMNAQWKAKLKDLTLKP
jgi:hypothetical protein